MKLMASDLKRNIKCIYIHKLLKNKKNVKNIHLYIKKNYNN